MKRKNVFSIFLIGLMFSIEMKIYSSVENNIYHELSIKDGNLSLNVKNLKSNFKYTIELIYDEKSVVFSKEIKSDSRGTLLFNMTLPPKIFKRKEGFSEHYIDENGKCRDIFTNMLIPSYIVQLCGLCKNLNNINSTPQQPVKLIIWEYNSRKEVLKIQFDFSPLIYSYDEEEKDNSIIDIGINSTNAFFKTNTFIRGFKKFQGAYRINPKNLPQNVVYYTFIFNKARQLKIGSFLKENSHKYAPQKVILKRNEGFLIKNLPLDKLPVGKNVLVFAQRLDNTPVLKILDIKEFYIQEYPTTILPERRVQLTEESQNEIQEYPKNGKLQISITPTELIKCKTMADLYWFHVQDDLNFEKIKPDGAILSKMKHVKTLVVPLVPGCRNINKFVLDVDAPGAWVAIVDINQNGKYDHALDIWGKIFLEKKALPEFSKLMIPGHNVFITNSNDQVKFTIVPQPKYFSDRPLNNKFFVPLAEVNLVSIPVGQILVESLFSWLKDNKDNGNFDCIKNIKISSNGSADNHKISQYKEILKKYEIKNNKELAVFRGKLLAEKISKIFKNELTNVDFSIDYSGQWIYNKKGSIWRYFKNLEIIFSFSEEWEKCYY